MSDIKIMKRSVFTLFEYVFFNCAICFWWEPKHVHQKQCFQCWSV